MSTFSDPEVRLDGQRPAEGAMAVTVRREGHDAAAVRITGEVGADRADELRLVLLAALDACPGGISLDVADVNFRDCSGLNALIDLEREAAERNRPLKLAAAAPAVRRLLDVAGPPSPAAGAAPGAGAPGTSPPGPEPGRGFEVTRARLEAPDTDDGLWVVFLEGTVEAHDGPALRNALAGADPGTPAYVIELGGLALMTPAAAAVLVELGRTLSTRGRRLLLVGPHRLTGPVVQLSRTSGFVEFHAHLDRALASASAPGPGHRAPGRSPGPEADPAGELPA
ncbi:STAS domain-containing protein [Streptomyces racemochromogenes]|uniref:STAS domain-containing protein n=1 Tax=Streptomyces racemochromogenes TaxID=67353 RepID=A0ABW7PPM3_9ACTN